MTNLQDRVRAEPAYASAGPDPRPAKSAGASADAAPGGAGAVGSSTALQKGRIAHGLLAIAATSARHGGGRPLLLFHCSRLLSAARLAPNPRKMGSWARVPLLFRCFNNGRALEDRHTGAVRGRRQVGETNPRCRSATPLASVTSLRSHAAHRPRCDGLRWPRGSRNTWRPEGGCPGSARRCSRW